MILMMMMMMTTAALQQSIVESMTVLGRPVLRVHTERQLFNSQLVDQLTGGAFPGAQPTLSPERGSLVPRS